MKVVIPTTHGRKLKRSKVLVNEILRAGNCRILESRLVKGSGVRIEAEKPLRNGRIHIRVSKRGEKYILEIHFDPFKHFDIMHSSEAHSIRDCTEVREFVKEYVDPIIRKHRPEYLNPKRKRTPAET